MGRLISIVMNENFAAGDRVFLRLQHYKQMSVKVRSSVKLSPQYFGPYKVLEHVSAQLLISWTYQQVLRYIWFFCLLSKKKLGEHDLVQHHLPDNCFTGDVKSSASSHTGSTSCEAP